jgi:hypothetical protein
MELGFVLIMVMTQVQNSHVIQRLSPQPPMTSLRGIQQCYSRGSYGTHTTFECLSLSSHCPSLFAT